MHDKLRYAQTLLSHQLPSGDVVEVLDRALDALIAKLERTQFAGTDRPRAARQRASANPRYVPAHVKRAVRERDGNRCTFVSEAGERCPARKSLEFDHIDEVARGGEATTQNLRVRCRSHNQYEAERTFGAGFMNEKREQAQRDAAEARTWTIAQEHARDVMACLRELGFRAGEARRAIEFCETIPEATLEGRVRAALKFLRPKSRGTSLEART